MKTIIILGIVQAFFLSLLIFSKKKKVIADNVLAVWFLFVGLHLLFSYFSFIELGLKYPYLLGISNFFPLLQGPFLFIYTSVIISKKQKFSSYHLLHGIPYLIITIFCCFDFYFLPAEEKLKYYFEIGDSPPIMYAIAFWLAVINGPIYVVLSFFKLKDHKKSIGENFSYTDKINLNWLKYVLLGLAIVWIIVVISKIAVEINKDLVEIGDIPIVLSLVILVFFLGFFGFKQSAIYTDSVVKKTETKLSDNEGTDKKQTERYQNINISQDVVNQYIKKIFEFMDSKKPYLDNKLTLAKLSESLDISTNHLSYIINEKLSKKFYYFINEYRVQKVKDSLKDEKFKNLTLLSIALESGFNSKSSFNDVFKKITGQTPSEYLKTSRV